MCFVSVYVFGLVNWCANFALYQQAALSKQQSIHSAFVLLPVKPCYAVADNKHRNAPFTINKADQYFLLAHQSLSKEKARPKWPG
jgi:hypothetical protein